MALQPLAVNAAAPPVSADSQACLECHDGSRVIEVPDTSPFSTGGRRPLVAIPREAYSQGVHARQPCGECHRHLTSLTPPHQDGTPEKIDCATCHDNRAKAAPQSETTPALKRVLRNIESYRRSFHARPNPDFPEIPNATCHECHDSHFLNVPADKQSQAYANWRLTTPKLCGKCHEDQLESYEKSVHAARLNTENNLKTAVCVDCHTTHEISGAHGAAFKLQSPASCGGCHPNNLNSYRRFYHGQIATLGYTTTAKCFDCHDSHAILSVSDAKSPVHPANRLKTCQKCHDGTKRPLATRGFASFTPHATTQDFERYPGLWIASRFMSGLLWFVVLFFGTHSVLWFYRERVERKNQPGRAAMGNGTCTIQRFTAPWRVAHLLFGLVVMVLLFTGMTLRNAQSELSPVVARFMGGVEVLGQMHRVAAVFMVGIFLVHGLYLLLRLWRDKTFSWFGPDSLLPNKKDFLDCREMFYWFVGRGEKPRFDRWSYFEKFDYWAVFWGMALIGGSGAILAFPHIAGEYFDGWVFNVALLIHGEEAFLAAVYLFTIHFFNNHFRPNKFPPPDIVMFTGRQTLEEMQRDHPAHYERLVVSGELESHRVKAASSGLIVASKILGVLLLGMGLMLLFFSLVGSM
ncbi:MAG: cytochrome C [Magnetococcales bacterium]|nr:cytochrome C [Magnetococcales bacterium]